MEKRATLDHKSARLLFHDSIFTTNYSFQDIVLKIIGRWKEAVSTRVRRAVAS